MTSPPWIILVNYRGAADTIECLSSLREDAPDANVVVVENGSGDDSAARIRTAHPWVRLIESPTNRGFASGNNLAVREALAGGAEFVWLLNNDTVVERGAVDELLRVMRSNPRLGIVSPRIDYYDRPGEAWFAGSKLDVSRGEAVHDNVMRLENAGWTALPWITGCAMFCRAEMLRQTGGFDERFFLNWEDVDLSMRAAGCGWQLGITPRALVRHKVSRSLAKVSSVATYYWMRNRLLWMSKHGATRGARMRARLGCMRMSIRGVKRGERGAWGTLRATIAGLGDQMRGRFGPLPQR